VCVCERVRFFRNFFFVRFDFFVLFTFWCALINRESVYTSVEYTRCDINYTLTFGQTVASDVPDDIQSRVSACFRLDKKKRIKKNWNKSKKKRRRPKPSRHSSPGWSATIRNVGGTEAKPRRSGGPSDDQFYCPHNT